MIRHLLKLAWNRKRSNALVVVEVFAAFLVVFAVATAVAHVARNAKLPLGFDAHDVWSVTCDSGAHVNEGETAERASAMDRLVREVRTVPGVVQAAAVFSVPYDDSKWEMGFEENGRRLQVEFLDVSDAFAEVLRLRVAHGRWFGSQDDGASFSSVVVNRMLARALFGDDDPIGRSLPRDQGDDEMRVVGVVEEFRKGGELATPGYFVFRRIRPEVKGAVPPRDIALRVAAGSGIDLEQAVLARLRAVDPSQTYEIRRLDDLRGAYFRLRLAPLLVGGLVASFLLLMVALGLLGVLWQNVTRRAREIALRRAAGASGADIRRQILLEVLLTTTPGVLLGTLLVAQIPMLDLVASLSRAALVIGLVAAVVAMYALTTLCALYPAWTAMRVLPAEALRCE